MNTNSDSYRESFRLISEQLRPGESLIWYDRPPRAQLIGRWALLLLFILLWTGFAIIWSSRGASEHVQGSSLLGAPLIVAGVILSVLLCLKIYFVSDLHYGLTDQRVITVNTRLPDGVRSYDAGWIEDVDHQPHENRGTVTLVGPSATVGRERVELFRIRESREVAQAIRSRLL